MAPERLRRLQRAWASPVPLAPNHAKAADKRRGGTDERADSGAREVDRGTETVTTGKRIAIVDDEEDIIAVLSLMVRKWGYVVEATASDGPQIVDAIATKDMHPEIVLMDYRMKSMNGLEAAKEIRRLDPSIKVIVESADDSIQPEVAKAGLGFLQKPFSSAQLRSALREALQVRKDDD